MYPCVPAGFSPSRWNCAATNSAALRCPSLPVFRPSSLSEARNSTYDHQRVPSCAAAANKEQAAAAMAPIAKSLPFIEISLPAGWLSSPLGNCNGDSLGADVAQQLPEQYNSWPCFINAGQPGTCTGNGRDNLS